MKKYAVLGLILALALCGCADQTVYEQVGDVYAVIAPEPAEIVVALPEDAAVLTAGGAENGYLYFCDGYTLTVQTLAGGDLDGTFRDLTGFSEEDLTVVSAAPDRYECVWTCAGEGGDQVGRMVLLDDGVCHYAVTVMADAADAGDLRQTWDAIMASVSLEDTGT